MQISDRTKDEISFLQIESFRVLLNRANLQTGSIFAVGRAVFSVLGVFKPNDIDFVVSSKLNDVAYKTAMNTQGQYDLLLDGY